MASDRPGALITGAARRIGAAIAKHFHAQGFDLILHCHHSTAAAGELCDSFNLSRTGSATVLRGDLSDPEDVARLIEEARQFPTLKVLINNASGFYPTPLDSITDTQWHDLMGSNLRGPFLLATGLARQLAENRGSIVNIADIHAAQGLRNHSIYCMAKAGNVGMTKALARDLAPAVRVNSVAPGAILWPESGAPDSPEIVKKRLAAIPAGRLGTAEEIAATVYFLAQEASYITGQTIAVDGGASHCL